MTKSYLGDIALAEETMDPSGMQAEVKKERSAWAQTASRWLGRKRGLGGQGGGKAPPKKKRKKAYQWGVAVNDLLLSMTGTSLQHFVAPLQPDDKQPEDDSVYNWPFLGISADQGPDGFSCSWFLRHQNVNADFWWDPSHQTWRDQESACRALGLKSFAYIVCAVLNMGHSPFDTKARWAQLCEATQEYLDTVAPVCPLLEHFQPLILEDWGIVGQDIRRADFINMLREDWSTHFVGATVKMCRFANWVDAAKQHDRSFHWTLLRVLYLGLQTDAFSAEKLEKAIANVELPKASDERTPVSRGNDCLKSFREANKNLLQLACQVLSDPMTQSLCRILSSIVAPVREAYGLLATKLRSTSAMRTWSLELARGAWWAPLASTLRLLSDASVLEHIKLDINVTALDMQLADDHPRVATNDHICSVACRYALALVGARCCRLSFLWAGWTGLQALLISDEAGEVTATAQLLLDQEAALRAASLRTEAFWKKLTQRSPLRHAPVQQLLRMLRASGNMVDARLQRVVAQRLSGIGQSKCAEDAFNMGRRLEQSASNKSALPAWRVWQRLVDGGLSNKLYKYEEPPWQDVPLPDGHDTKWPETMFDIRFRDAPSWMRRIIGMTDRTEWFKTSPLGSGILQADLQLMVAAWREDRWADIARGCAWSMLARGRDLLVQRPGGGRCFFCLCDVQGVAALGWPAIVEMQGGDPSVACFDLQAAPEWLLITDHSWRATTCSWLSPLSQALSGIVSPRDVKAAPQLRAHFPRPPSTLMKEACRQAFWDFGVGAMKWICTQSGVDMPPRPTLFSLLQAALMCHLPELSQDEMVDILRKRLAYNDATLDLGLVDSGFADLIEEQDRKDFTSEVAHCQSLRNEIDQFKEEWAAKVRSMRSGNASKRKASCFKTSGTQHAMKLGAFDVQKQFSLEDAQEMCPWPAKVYEDPHNGRWQGHWKGIGSASRSFHLYGHGEALRQILAWAWKHALMREGFPLSACPIAGIFSQEEAASASNNPGGAASSSTA